MRVLVGILMGLFSGSAVADYQCDIGVELLRGSIDGGGMSYYIPPEEYIPPSDTEVPTGGGVPTGNEFPLSTTDEDFDGWAISGRYYLAPVDTSSGPYDLAPFVSRTSSVGGVFGRLETDDTGFETEYWDVDVRIVVGRSWVLEAELGGGEVEESTTDRDVNIYRASVGYYVGAMTELKLGLNREDADFEKYDRWSAQIQHVQEFENQWTWQARALIGTVSGDHDTFRDVDGHEIEIDMSLYFNPKLGVGINYVSRDRGDAGDIDTQEVWAKYFATDKLSFELSYYSEDNDGRNIESDGVLFETRYRI